MTKILRPKTITFDSNGGSFVPSQTVLKNEKIYEPDVPFKAGYSFNGWFTDNDTFDNRWDFDDIPEEDMTLFAAWNGGGLLTPTAEDFNIEGAGTHEYDGNPKEVTVTAKPGKTTGKITVNYEGAENTQYAATTNAPTNPGSYKVRFDVEAAEGWNAMKGLSAGTLDIQQINNATALRSYLSTLSDNNINNPHLISLNISDSEISNIKYALIAYDNTYVILDLSGSTITDIPANAFGGEPSSSINNIIIKTLTGIILPSSVEKIGQGAFQNCENLTSITIPSSVTSIGQSAFAGTGLTSVTFATGSNIADESFGQYAFPEGSNGSGNSLKNAYSTGKAGTYTRTGNSTWTKK